MGLGCYVKIYFPNGCHRGRSGVLKSITDHLGPFKSISNQDAINKSHIIHYIVWKMKVL